VRTVNFLDLAPFRRSTVGFDRLFDLMNATTQDPSEAYPPFDLQKLDDSHFKITLAVAGFRPEEIEIVSQQNMLTVTGRKVDQPTDDKFVHRGIMIRSFERHFQIADFVVVENATFDNGLLTVTLRREVPEAMQPKKVEISVAPAAITEQPAKEAENDETTDDEKEAAA
tara:strand:+ start:18429 stop:18935 length:507 start_codon:yes stop_codon:yes gene_type:complete